MKCIIKLSCAFHNEAYKLAHVALEVRTLVETLKHCKKNWKQKSLLLKSFEILMLLANAEKGDSF